MSWEQSPTPTRQSGQGAVHKEDGVRLPPLFIALLVMTSQWCAAATSIGKRCYRADLPELANCVPLPITASPALETVTDAFATIVDVSPELIEF
jgi:hypothetical protein